MSHITTYECRLDDMDALSEYFENNMKDKGFQILQNAKVRYWGGKVSNKVYDYVIKCPGRYDIGVEATKDGYKLDADFSYADFYNHFNVQHGSRNIENFLTEAQNEQKFRRWAKKKKYKVKEVVDKLSGKKQLIAE